MYFRLPGASINLITRVIVFPNHSTADLCLLKFKWLSSCLISFKTTRRWIMSYGVTPLTCHTVATWTVRSTTTWKLHCHPMAKTLNICCRNSSTSRLSQNYAIYNNPDNNLREHGMTCLTLTSLEDEDLQLLGVSDPDVRHSMLTSFGRRNRKVHTYDRWDIW